MYKKWFYLEWKNWNNAFSYMKRVNKKLYIPHIIDLDIKDLDKIKIQSDKQKIAFEEYDYENNLQTSYWLENFYKIKWKDKDLIFFDNHNHALFFWYEAKNKWIIKNQSILYHIDEHADTREAEEDLKHSDAINLEKIFIYTNYKVNVWNYIIPAKKQWLIWKIIQIRNETNLEDYIDWKLNFDWDIILNLDLDFFVNELDYIDYNLKKKVILNIANKAKIITVASSPFFIEQKLAIKIFKDIFNING